MLPNAAFTDQKYNKNNETILQLKISVFYLNIL